LVFACNFWISTLRDFSHTTSCESISIYRLILLTIILFNQGCVVSYKTLLRRYGKEVGFICAGLWAIAAGGRELVGDSRGFGTSFLNVNHSLVQDHCRWNHSLFMVVAPRMSWKREGSLFVSYIDTPQALFWIRVLAHIRSKHIFLETDTEIARPLNTNISPEDTMDQIKDEVGDTAPIQHLHGPVKSEDGAPQVCHFLSLPPELRNMIYKLLLVSRKHIQPRGPYQVGSPHYPPYPKQPCAYGMQSRHGPRPLYPPRTNTENRESLALACTFKQIKDEALSVYYGVNTFKLGTLDVLWVQLYLSPLAERLITRVVHDYQGAYRTPDLKIIVKCENLQYLKLNLRNSPTHNGSFYPNSLFRALGLKALKQVRCQELVVSCVPAVASQQYYPPGHVEKFTKMLRKVLYIPSAD
jgi:hypothetical protein